METTKKITCANFEKGDLVHITGVPPVVNGIGNPFFNRYGIVVHSQSLDVSVSVDGLTDSYGIGFLPESLTKVDVAHLMESEGMDEGLNGIDLLRNAIEWFNYRNETINEDKNPYHLINEYVAALLYGKD